MGSASQISLLLNRNSCNYDCNCKQFENLLQKVDSLTSLVATIRKSFENLLNNQLVKEIDFYLQTEKEVATELNRNGEFNECRMDQEELSHSVILHDIDDIVIDNDTRKFLNENSFLSPEEGEEVLESLSSTCLIDPYYAEVLLQQVSDTICEDTLSLEDPPSQNFNTQNYLTASTTTTFDNHLPKEDSCKENSKTIFGDNVTEPKLPLSLPLKNSGSPHEAAFDLSLDFEIVSRNASDSNSAKTEKDALATTINCSSCNKTFSSRRNYRKHCDTLKHKEQIQSTSEKLNLKENDRDAICEDSLVSLFGNNPHTRSGKEKVKYKCQKCEKSFSRSDHLKRHSQIHIRRDEYCICEICGKSLKTSNYLQVHLRIHTGEKPYKCLQCTATFRKSSELREHRKSHSAGKKNLYECEICGKPYPSASNLSRHRRIIHNGQRPKPFKCDICTKGFIDTFHLNKHRRVHTGEKPFSCQTCGKAFSDSTIMRRHNRIHAGEKPFGCSVCRIFFRCKSNLNNHQRNIHSDTPKNFICDICGQSFFVFNELVKHQRSHTGEKPHKCPFCSKGFRTSGNLAKHRRSRYCSQTKEATEK